MSAVGRSESVIDGKVDPKALERAIGQRIERIAEFKRITEEAERRGIRVWVFGGSAASLAHYAKWGMMKETGDTRFVPERFDDDLTSIFRSTQDIDIVIDKGAREAMDFKKWLSEQFPYFQGNKDQWEVRSLSEPSGTNGALINDFDFANQHTDSQSTALIELTKPAAAGRNAEPRVRDLKSWDSKAETPFLHDVANGEISYYHSPTHEMTSRAKTGMNPPILSVVRYLTKAFQFGLKMKPADLARIAAVVRDFNPHAPMHPYVLKWLQKNGAKLALHAIDLPFTLDTLDTLGLRTKLIALASVPDERGASFWLAKEPLRDRSDHRNTLGGPTGRTAGELGITEVAHATRDFETWESIRKSPLGTPLFFISREGAPGEAAIHGNGLYTEAGSEGWGARGGFSIRMKVDPQAREGVDFKTLQVLDYATQKNLTWVVWYTRDRLHVIPESLDISAEEALAFVTDPANAKELGKKELLKKRIERRFLDATERPKIEKAIGEYLKKPAYHKEIGIWALKAPAFRTYAAAFPEWMESVAGGGKLNYELFNNVLNDPALIKHPKWTDWMLLAIKKGDRTDEALDIIKPKEMWEHPGWGKIVKAVFEGRNMHGFEALYYQQLALPRAVREPEWAMWVETGIRELARRHDDIARKILATPEAVKHEKWLYLIKLLISEAAAKKEDRLVHWMGEAFGAAQAAGDPRWKEALMTLVESFDEPGANKKFLTDPELIHTAKDRREWIAAIGKALDGKKGGALAVLLANPEWKKHRKEWEPLVDRFVSGMPQWDVEKFLESPVLRSDRNWLHWVDVLGRTNEADFTALGLLLDEDAMKLPGWKEAVGELAARTKYCYGAERKLREFAEEHGEKIPESLLWAEEMEKQSPDYVAPPEVKACVAAVSRAAGVKRRPRKR